MRPKAVPEAVIFAGGVIAGVDRDPKGRVTIVETRRLADGRIQVIDCYTLAPATPDHA